MYQAVILAGESVTVRRELSDPLGKGDEMPHLTAPVFRCALRDELLNLIC